jgi:hypothetical protein
VGSAGRNPATGIGRVDSRPGASAAGRQPELGPAGRRAHPGRATDMGLGPTRAFVGRAAGRRAAGRLTRQHADIDLGRAAADWSAVSGLGRARCSATDWSTGSRAASAAGRGSAASSAPRSCAASAAAAGSRAAAACARVAGRAWCSRRFPCSTASVMGSARRRAASLGSSGRRTCPASGRARTIVGRARGAARGRSFVELLGGPRRAPALDRMACS